MCPLAIVKDFDIFEDCISGVIARFINAMMNQFDLKGVEKALGDGIIPAITLLTHAGFNAMVVQKFPVTVSGVLAASIAMRYQSLSGLRFHRAISSASLTRPAVIRDPMDHPTTARENRSITTARYSQPSRVGI